MEPADVRCRKIPCAIPHMGVRPGDYAVRLPNGDIGTFRYINDRDAGLIRHLLDDEVLPLAVGHQDGQTRPHEQPELPQSRPDASSPRIRRIK